MKIECKGQLVLNPHRDHFRFVTKGYFGDADAFFTKEVYVDNLTEAKNILQGLQDFMLDPEKQEPSSENLRMLIPAQPYCGDRSATTLEEWTLTYIDEAGLEYEVEVTL